MDGGNKNETKVLTTDDIRARADNWSLAGDVGLLAHLERFSEELCKKTQETQLQFNELLDNFEETNKKIYNTTNQFLALQNCQFVENRVYDEETPTEELIKQNVVNDEEQEKLLLIQYKEAVEIGIKLLDTHFQEVELPPNSDSDDDDEEDSSTGNVSVIWKPKNPYSGKRFPLLIGSSEWWADDSVGLGDFKDENVDSSKAVSDSDSDLDSTHKIEKKKVEVSSSASSEDDENEKAVPGRPSQLADSSEDIFTFQRNYNYDTSTSDFFGVTTNSIPDENVPDVGDVKVGGQTRDDGKRMEDVDVRGKEDVTSETSAPVETSVIKQSVKVNNDFTRELAAKLGSFNKVTENVKSVEKPAGESVREEIPGKTGSLFDGGNGDDNDDDDDSNLFSGTNDMIGFVGKKKSNLFFDGDNDDDLLFGGGGGSGSRESSQRQLLDARTGLFDSDDFVKTGNKEPVVPESGMKTSQTVAKSEESNPVRVPGQVPRAKGLFDDVDDDDTLFSPNFASKSSSGSRHAFDGKMSGESVKGKETEVLKGKTRDRLFDDEDDESASDDAAIFQSEPDTGTRSGYSQPNDFSSNVEPAISSIFERSSATVGAKQQREPVAKADPTTERRKTDLFSEDTSSLSNVKTITVPGKVRLPGMTFQDDEDNDDNNTPSVKNNDENSLFAERLKPSDGTSISSSRSSLFDDVAPASKSRLASVFDRDKTPKFDDDDDDLFHSPEDASLFGAPFPSKSDVESDLFRAPSKTRSDTTGKSSLFADLDDGDLFTNPGTKSEEDDIFGGDSLFVKSDRGGAGVGKTTSLFGVEKVAGGLFEGADDDDLFDGAVATKVAATAPVPSVLSPDENVLFGETVATTGEDNSKRDPLSDVSNRGPAPAGVSKLSRERTEMFQKEETQPVKPVAERKPDGTESVPKSVESATKPATRVEPPRTLNLTKDTDPGQGKVKSIGKLNIPQNLRSRLETVVQPSSSKETVAAIRERIGAQAAEAKVEPDEERPFESSSNLLKCPSKDRVKIPVRRRPQSRQARQRAIRDSGTNFMGNDDDSVASESRSAAESVSTKSLDMGSSSVDVADSTSYSSNTKLQQQPETASESPDAFAPTLPSHHPLSPSTDEEDFFNVPELDTNLEKEDHRLFKSDLFEPGASKKADENLLFDGAPVLSPLSPQKKSKTNSMEETADDKAESLFEPESVRQATVKPAKGSGLFQFDDDDDFGDGGKGASVVTLEDDDDDDSLFGGKEKEPFGGFGKSKLEKGGVKKSLFDEDLEDLNDDDDDDDDDLFGGKSVASSSGKTLTESVGKVQKAEKPAVQSAEKTGQSFVDPLGLMTNNE